MGFCTQLEAVLFFSARLQLYRKTFLLGLVMWGMATVAHSACTLPDGPENTLVPEGYRFPASGKWQICEKGAWVAGEEISDARGFTANNTGVCLPLENQFTKKNGVISMNFVPEKSRRNFYGFEHECVASTWWRIHGGATVSNPNESVPDPVSPPAEAESNPAADLDQLYDDVNSATEPPPAQPEPAPDVKEIPSFSAGTPAPPKVDVIPPSIPEPEPTPVFTPPVVDSAPPAPAPDFRARMESDYQTCLNNCRQNQANRLDQAEQKCKREIPKPGQGKWNSNAERNFRRCRILAAREVNNALRACLLPCKKQAGKHIWTGP